ncbi:uncharacterized protein [Euphorbia lathyris]|uniref:uncharacterized protein n=1 Tax=Euphorbia lathyris TaxID=212925 RepID=UPI0033139CAF
MLIDVDLMNELPVKMGIEREGKQIWIDVVYERLPSFCKVCSNIGHMAYDCRKNKKPLEKVLEALVIERKRTMVSQERKFVKKPNAIQTEVPVQHATSRIVFELRPPTDTGCVVEVVLPGSPQIRKEDEYSCDKTDRPDSPRMDNILTIYEGADSASESSSRTKSWADMAGEDDNSWNTVSTKKVRRREKIMTTTKNLPARNKRASKPPVRFK